MRFSQFFPSQRPIRLGRETGQGCVAISYLKEPFQKISNLDSRAHTNWQECRAMAEAWVNHGFRVEIVDCRDSHYFPPKDVRFAVDICLNLERWAPSLPKDCLKILHATGAHWLTQNIAELARLEALKFRRGTLLAPRRQAPSSYGIEVADCGIVLGNQFTESTFRYANKPITRIPISSAFTFDFHDTKNWEKCRNQFIWFGSYGMIHKGLDLVLETFAKHPSLQLTICGRPEKEADFFSCYQKELCELPNIRMAGWIDPASREFDEIRKTHGFAVYPSCSEGGGGALIHAMHAGLVPIATAESSVDLGKFGIEIKEGTCEAVEESVLKAASCPADELADRARRTWGHVRNVHTLPAFQSNYSSWVSRLVGQDPV